MSIQVVCFSCGKEVFLPHPVGRSEECPSCGVDLRVCKNCQHYDVKAYNECWDPQADRVLEKERANFCDLFVPGFSGRHKLERESLLDAAEKLFKK